jgi:hypothetical protein
MLVYVLGPCVAQRPSVVWFPTQQHSMTFKVDIKAYQSVDLSLADI